MENLLKKYKELNHSLSFEEENDLFLDYIFQTNKLEGNKLTLAQTSSIIEKGFVSGENISIKDVYEQKGSYKALLRMLKAVNDKEELSVELISELNWLYFRTWSYIFIYCSQKKNYLLQLNLKLANSKQNIKGKWNFIYDGSKKMK